MTPRVAIIGAGLAGLVAADRLLARRFDVTLIDKGRRAGGRFCTRSFELATGKTVTFDLGPQLLYTRLPGDKPGQAHLGVLRLAQRLGWEQPHISHRCGHIGAAGEHMTAVPSGLAILGGMRELAFRILGRHGSTIDFRDHTVVERLEYTDDRWKISTRSLLDGFQTHCHAHALVLTAPVPQALELLAGSRIALPDGLSRILRGVGYSRAMALYGLFPDAPTLPGGGVSFEEGPVAWISDNHAKGISQVGPAITAVTTHDWATVNWEVPDEVLIARLSRELYSWVGRPATTPPLALQRWRWAKPLNPLSASCAVLRDCNLILAGDGFASIAPDPADGAIASGEAAANRAAGLISRRAGHDTSLTLARPRRYTLEIAVSTPDEAVRAVEAGADRLELSSALEVGGVTPSLSLFRHVQRAAPEKPIYVLIRPRPGDFSYTDREFEVMLNDAELLLKEGAAGIVFGILKGTAIDRRRCGQLLELAPEKSVFHRAFDVLPEPFAAIEELIDLGFQRVLTSGQASTAEAGTTLLAALMQHAGWQIEILPAGNIRPENVADLVRETRCEQVHSSARAPVAPGSAAVRCLPGMGMDSGRWLMMSPEIVAGLRQALNDLAGHDDDDPIEAS